MNFKGLNNNGKWVEGHGIIPDGGDYDYIVNSPYVIEYQQRVRHDTVCVGSRITDANGDEVFENDIIKIAFGKDEYYYVVKYDTRCGQYYLLNSNVRFDTINDLSAELKFHVVGNAYTDKDLLNRALSRNKD